MAAGPDASSGTNPLTAARFSVVIDGYEVAAFNELTEMTSEVEPTEYVEQAVSGEPAANRVKPATITLRRGLTGGMELWAWHETVRNGQMSAARKSASLLMYSTDGTPVAKFWLTNAWPSVLSLSALKAGASEILYESVTLVCENLQRVSPA